MLLVEYLAEVGALTEEEAKRPERRALTAVSSFTLGPHYLIHCTDGKVYELAAMEDMLSIMQGEFLMYPEFIPVVTKDYLAGGPHFSNRASGTVLTVRPAHHNNFLPSPPVGRVIEVIRTAVLMYSLTGNWDHFGGIS